MSADQLISKFEIYVKEQEALSQKWKEELDNTEFEQALTIDERLSEMKHCLEKLKELNNEAA